MSNQVHSSTASLGTPLRIAVAGLGRTGWRNHLAPLSRLGGLYEITGVCDPLPARCEEARATFGCPAWPSLPEMLREGAADWVVIATPTPLHEAQVIEALEAGFHVLCEKPLAGDLAAARRMVAVAEARQRHLSIFHNRRYAADFMKVREILSSGRLGRLLLIKISMNTFSRRWDWQTLRKCMGGILLNAGAHFIDQALQLVGGGVRAVSCTMERAVSAGDAEDHVRILLQPGHGPQVEIELSHADAYGAERWKIYGTHGGLTGSDKSLRWKYTDWSQLPPREAEESPTADRSYNRETIPWTEESWSADPGAESKEIRFYRDLHAHLARGCPPPITPGQALEVVALTSRCFQAAQAPSLPS